MRTISVAFYKLVYFITIFPILALAGDPAMDAYNGGDIKTARVLLAKELTDAKTPDQQWAASFRNAWLSVEIDLLKDAIEHFNNALSLAIKLKDPAREGKTLAELGLAYSHMGLYQMASTVLLRAIEIAAPKGNIKIPMVWGQATQELGAIHLATGNLVEAEKALQQTYSYAQSNGIFPGISEGGAYLAEVSLLKGNFAKAEEYAERALRSSTTCDCSQHIKSWTQIIMARVLMEKQKLDPSIKTSLIQNAIEDAMKNARKYHNKRSVAEAKVLQSRLLPVDKSTEKIALLKESFAILQKMNSELRGAAEAELGRAYARDNDHKLAEFYLLNGIKVTKELFRSIDYAHVIGDLGELEGLKGFHRKELAAFSQKADLLEKSKASQPLYETQKAIITRLREKGYHRMALQWIDKALKNLESMQDVEDDTKVRETRSAELLQLQEWQSESALRTTGQTDSD